MSRVALDSNILVYAELEPETEKGMRAHALIAAAAPRGMIAVQALFEFLAAVRRKRPASLPSAIAKVESWLAVFVTPPTSAAIVSRAALLVRDHGFQVWDAVIFEAVRDGRAKHLLSEDMQDGLLLEGVRIFNPFRAENSGAIDAALGV